jgi:hypothetical protein
VPGIGTCAPKACPASYHGAAANLTITRGTVSVKRHARKYIQNELLDVQDGSNFFELDCATPRAPLPSSVHETAMLEQLARTLAPKFYTH